MRMPRGISLILSHTPMIPTCPYDKGRSRQADIRPLTIADFPVNPVCHVPYDPFHQQRPNPMAQVRCACLRNPFRNFLPFKRRSNLEVRSLRAVSLF